MSVVVIQFGKARLNRSLVKSSITLKVWSRGVARWFRWDLSVAGPFSCRCLNSPAMLPFPHPAHPTGRADLPHPALGEDSRNRRRPLPVTLSATSENIPGVISLIANLPFRRRFLRPPSTEVPSLHVTRVMTRKTW
jgi:hypothetical protein